MITEGLLVRAPASSCFFEQGEEEEMKGMLGWILQLSSNSLSPNPVLLEKLRKLQFCIPGCDVTPPSKLLVAQDPAYHNWAQMQLVEDASSPCHYKVFKTPPSDRPCDFSPVLFSLPHLWGLQSHPGVLCPNKPLLFNSA